MGASYKSRCVVLKKTKLGEADLIVTMLDDEGRQVRGVAKGARKPGNKRCGARLEPFSVVDLVLYPGRSLEQITDVRAIEPNAKCREDLDRSSACNLVAELLEKSTRDGEVGERAYACACACFAAVGTQPAEQALLLACACMLKIVAMMGVRPALHECAYCGSPLSDGVFDISAGGLLCEDCAEGAGGNVDPDLIPWLDLCMGSTFAQLEEVHDAPSLQLLDFCDAWVKEHLGLQLKTVTFLRAQL